MKMHHFLLMTSVIHVFYPPNSDGTLNPNGVRFGSAEIYNVVESFKEIQDSLCVAQRSKCGSEERVLLFLKMATGQKNKIIKNKRKYLPGTYEPGTFMNI